MNETAALLLAEFSSKFSGDDLTPRHVRQCGRCLADTYAVAVAGRVEPAGQAALRYLRRSQLVSPPAAGPSMSSLWGLRESAPPEIAAWWNGIAAHALDYDDVAVPLRGHPSAVLWPALLALAEAHHLAGERIASAYVVGFEVIGKIARPVAYPHYAKGWHSTASIGVLGCAVACAHLLGLERDQTANAIGLAVAEAAGTRENVGTDAKSYQVGHAAASGVRAAGLAAAGFRSAPGSIDGPYGYLRTHADGMSLAESLASLGEAPLEMDRTGLDIKKYPMCYASHHAIDAVLALRSAHNISLADVTQVNIRSSRGALEPLIHPYPGNGLEAKFSLPYAIACALADGGVRLASFTTAAVHREHIRNFFGRVRWQQAEGPAIPRWAEVSLSLADGTVRTERVEHLHGSTRRPLSDEDLAGKIDDCLGWAGRADGDHPRHGADLLRVCTELSGTAGHGLVHALQEFAAVDLPRHTAGRGGAHEETS